MLDLVPLLLSEELKSFYEDTMSRIDRAGGTPNLEQIKREVLARFTELGADHRYDKSDLSRIKKRLVMKIKERETDFLSD